jgi:hypothetical protein
MSRKSGKIGPVTETATKFASNFMSDKYKAEKATNGQVENESMEDIVRNIRTCPYTRFETNKNFVDIYYQKGDEEAVKVGCMQQFDPSKGMTAGAGYIDPKAYEQIKKDAEDYLKALQDMQAPESYYDELEPPPEREVLEISEADYRESLSFDDSL